jgi:hypothetical protein
LDNLSCSITPIINVKEYRRTNKKWTIQRNWQQDEDTKQKHSTICVGHHYVQGNTNNISKSPPTNNWK